MFMAPKPSVDPLVEHRSELLVKYFSGRGLILIRAEQLMMGEEDGVLRAVLERLPDPTRLRILKPVVVPRRVEAEKLPMLVVQAEEASLALFAEARILEEELEIGMSTRIHIVIAVQAPRSDLVGFPWLHRPIGKKAVAILVFPAGIVDLAKMDHLHIPVLALALLDRRAHRGGDELGAGDPRSPITH